MPRISVLSGIFLFACIILSCGKNELALEESPLLHSICGVKDPAKELPWLKTIIEQAESGPDKFQYAGTIQMINYQDKTYFIYQKYHMSCMACLVYDCQGNQLEILADPDLHMSLIERMSEKSIIYRSPFN